ncbi:hypothetical protein KDU71_17320 [Carboxylicivirga sediminis]|uniref:Zf-HC2 domain-containing protein n=1 Tax=Carboxylicivirga sediminis TaxID=2006564 RepID=A0A941F5Q8_9BACT|nr:hypothetical protein [Carboxylicivirga sediminis]MBR8537333.1 hypothetical protein [Carboxylicivirga sediminis]
METQGKMMITCKEATFLISKEQQDKLRLSERFQLKLHLLMCKYCRRFSAQVSFMTKAIGRMKKRIEQQGVEVKLTDEQKQRMNKRLNDLKNN